MDKKKKVLLLMGLALAGVVIYMQMKKKKEKEKTPKQADPLDPTLVPQGIIDDTPNVRKIGGAGRQSAQEKIAEKIVPKKTKRAKKKVDTYCTDLLTFPRAFGKTARKNLPIIGAHGSGQIELTPMQQATDLPYTFKVQNIATGKYYTHYHGRNPNGGWGTGGYVGRQCSPSTKYKDLPAGDYKLSVTTKSGCKQSTIVNV